MRQLLYFLIPIFFLCSFGDKSPIGTYTLTDGEFYYKLTLTTDSIFYFEESFSKGSTSSKGKWRRIKDTLFLYDYLKPWTIEQLEEIRVDSLGDNSVIDVVLNDTNVIHIRGSHGIYIDGYPTKVKYDYKTKRDVATDFKIWVNDECNNPQLTDQTGRVKFQNKKINKISFDYDNYLIKNKKNNYFILFLSNYPIYASPPTLPWTKWLLTADNLIPLQCNKRLDYIKLKK